MTEPSAKILTSDEAVAQFSAREGRTIVFTNGVFDVLHRGHVQYLYAARALGAVLIVGLNDDASVKRLKGPTRPVNAEADRAFVLAALACVDAVVTFHEDTPARLIAALTPDVLVKGGDYTPDQVVGRDTVEAAGGRVVIMPFVDGHSTTSMIHRMQEERE